MSTPVVIPHPAYCWDYDALPHEPDIEPGVEYVTDLHAITKPCVYFVEGAGLVKIGMSATVSSRFADLRRTIPCPIRMVCIVQVHNRSYARVMEKRFHSYYRHYRRHGEWFDLPEDWLDHIRDTVGGKLKLPSPFDASARTQRTVPLTWIGKHWRPIR